MDSNVTKRRITPVFVEFPSAPQNSGQYFVG